MRADRRDAKLFLCWEWLVRSDWVDCRLLLVANRCRRGRLWSVVIIRRSPLSFVGCSFVGCLVAPQRGSSSSRQQEPQREESPSWADEEIAREGSESEEWTPAGPTVRRARFGPLPCSSPGRFRACSPTDTPGRAHRLCLLCIFSSLPVFHHCAVNPPHRFVLARIGQEQSAARQYAAAAAAATEVGE